MMTSVGASCSTGQLSQIQRQVNARQQPCSVRARSSYAAPSSNRFLSGTALPSSHRLEISRRQQKMVTRMGLFGLGVPEIAVIAGVAVLIFGPSKLPELGRELGKSVKSFQTAAKEFETELKSGAEDAEEEGKKIVDAVNAKKDDILK